MNKNIFYLTALLFIFGCSNQDSETEAMETAETQSLLLEYMWCDFGPNTSGESLDKLVADFNEVTKNSDHPVESAWGYFPTFETDAYDAIWLNVELKGLEASCHVGYKSCFYRSIPTGNIEKDIKLQYKENKKTFDPKKIYGDAPNPTKL